MKTSLITLLFLLFFAHSKAQKTYINLSVGYAFSTGSNPDESQSTLSNYNFGKGLNPGINVGYMFNKHIGLDLGTSKLFYGYVNIPVIKVANGGDTITSSGGTCQYCIKSTIVIPSIKFVGYDSSGITQFYMRVGPAIDFNGHSDWMISDLHTYYKTRVGLSGTLGIGFKLSKRALLTIEASYVGVKLHAKSGGPFAEDVTYSAPSFWVGYSHITTAVGMQFSLNSLFWR